MNCCYNDCKNQCVKARIESCCNQQTFQNSCCEQSCCNCQSVNTSCCQDEECND